MGIVERVKALQQTESLSTNTKPSRKLQEVLVKSEVEKRVEELSKLTPMDIVKEVIEKGKKMVIVLSWPPEEEREQEYGLSIIK